MLLYLITLSIAVNEKMPPTTRSQKKKIVAANVNRIGQNRIAAKSAAVHQNVKIPTLNDDCLLKIFSYLPMRYLYTRVRNCSRRFRDIADLTVKHKFRKNRVSTELQCYGPQDLLAMQRFGKFILRLRILGDFFPQNRHADVVAALLCCTSLKIVKIEHIDLSLLPVRGKCWKNVEDLSMISCSGSSWKHRKIISACQMLRELKVKMLGPITNDLIASINEHANIKRIWWILADNICVADQLKLLQLRKLKMVSRFLYTHPYRQFQGIFY